MNRRLYRSRTDSVIGGVAGGVAEYLDVDPSIVRIVWAVLAIVTGGIFFVLYIVMWIVVPQGAQAPGYRYQPGPGAVPGWVPPADQPTAPIAPASGMPAADAPAMGAVDMTDASTTTTPIEGSTAPLAGEPVAGWNAYAAPEEHHRRRGRGGGMVFGAVLILLGAWFLLDQYIPGLDSDLLWPLALVVIGGALLFVAMRRSSEG